MKAGSTADVPGIFDGEWRRGDASHTLKSYDPSTGRLMATIQGVSVARVSCSDVNSLLCTIG